MCVVGIMGCAWRGGALLRMRVILDPPSLLFLTVSFDACMLDSRYLAMQDIIGY